MKGGHLIGSEIIESIEGMKYRRKSRRSISELKHGMPTSIAKGLSRFRGPKSSRIKLDPFEIRLREAESAFNDWVVDRQADRGAGNPQFRPQLGAVSPADFRRGSVTIG